MRVLLVGAGAVGIVLHRAIEQQKGNEVTFLLRAGHRKTRGFERTKIADARSGELRVRERPAAVEAGQVKPGFDTLLLCVRADQTAAALDDVGPLPPACRVATVTPGPQGLQLLRARFPGHPAARVAPAFLAYADDDVIQVWQPPLLKTQVCHDDGDAAAASFAEELAAALDQGGVPARARAKMPLGVDGASDMVAPLLSAYALAGYDADGLAADRRLQHLAADAMAEVLSLDGAPGFAAGLVKHTAAPLLRAALASGQGLFPPAFFRMWRAHGPKIDGQTHASMTALVRRAKSAGRTVNALEEMLHRLDARPPATVAAVADTPTAPKETA